MNTLATRIESCPDAGHRIERHGHALSDAPSFEPGELCAAIVASPSPLARRTSSSIR
jgi:hypothetical protein